MWIQQLFWFHNCVRIIVPPSIIYCNTLDMFYFFLQPLNFSQLAFLVKLIIHCMLSLTRLGLCPYRKSICRAIHQNSLWYDVLMPHSRRHPTAGRHLVQRSWSSSTAVTCSARGLDVVSPLIGLSEEQSEFYRLSKAFADRGACRLFYGCVT